MDVNSDNEVGYTIEDVQLMQNNGKINTKTGAAEIQEVSAFRRILPQVLASCVKHLLILDLAISISFPAVLIPQLTGVRNRAPEETLWFNDIQASWFASLAFICQPIGSTLSGIVLEELGRKKAMMIVNLPHIAAWLMLYYATELKTVFSANILLGLGVGFMEAPVLTYVGEITEPSVRGILSALASVMSSLGAALLYIVGSKTTWRNTALFASAVPMITIVCLTFVPETPIWLLSKDRKVQALRSLQWLRGWVTPMTVKKEFHQMRRYVETSNYCRPCQRQGIKCEHPKPTLGEKIKQITRQKSLKPLFIILMCFFFSVVSIVQTMRPYFIQIFEKYHMAIDPSLMMILVGVTAFIGNITAVVGIRIIGKRKMVLASMTSTAVFSFCLAVYSWRIFPYGLSSFDKVDFTGKPETYTPIVLFMSLAFSTNLGITVIPWVMISEIFPNQTRSMSSGITAACVHLMYFTSTKSYYSLETSISLFGMISFYAFVAIAGTLFMYNYLPETEGKTLEEIEAHFSDNSLKLSDHKIRPTTVTIKR
ncbi:facilitated trehalose transporter Tret1-like [Culicoides brevitarsis]|uniref:facilitated trehalose transporter Tret1-like n=1 Tax=Culicoides brevitarsis TaxID=469753 RepID=UPI00307CA4D3